MYFTYCRSSGSVDQNRTIGLWIEFILKYTKKIYECRIGLACMVRRINSGNLEEGLAACYLTTNYCNV